MLCEKGSLLVTFCKEGLILFYSLTDSWKKNPLVAKKWKWRGFVLNFLPYLESEITNMIILQIESCDGIILNVMILNWFKEYLAIKVNTGDREHLPVAFKKWLYCIWDTSFYWNSFRSGLDFWHYVLSFQRLLFSFRTNFIFHWYFHYLVVDDTWDAEEKVWLHLTSQSTAVVHLWKAPANSSCYLGARLHAFVPCIYKSVCLDIKLSGN